MQYIYWQRQTSKLRIHGSMAPVECGYNHYLNLFCKNNHEKNKKGRKKKIVQKAFDFN